MDASSADLPSKVRVVVRVRPFLPHEAAAAATSGKGGPASCVSVLGRRASGSSAPDDEVTVHLKDQATRSVEKVPYSIVLEFVLLRDPFRASVGF